MFACLFEKQRQQARASFEERLVKRDREGRKRVVWDKRQPRGIYRYCPLGNTFPSSTGRIHDNNNGNAVAMAPSTDWLFKREERETMTRDLLAIPITIHPIDVEETLVHPKQMLFCLEQSRSTNGATPTWMLQGDLFVINPMLDLVTEKKNEDGPAKEV